MTVSRKRCAYSKPAALGSLSTAFTSKPARRYASIVIKRWAVDAFAGTETATSIRSFFRIPAFDRWTSSSRTWARKPVSSSTSRTDLEPMRTSESGWASFSRRLNERSRVQPGSVRPKTSSPDGDRETMEGIASWCSKETTG